MGFGIMPCAWSQGTDDLEESMSERLQELPPPLGRQNNSKHEVDSDFSFPQDMDTDAAAPSKVSPASHCTFVLNLGSSSGIQTQSPEKCCVLLLAQAKSGHLCSRWDAVACH